MGTREIKRFVLIGMIIGLAVAIGGCASSGDQGASSTTTPTDSSTSSTPTTSSTPKSSPEDAAPMKTVPANSKLAKIETGMTEQQVRKAIGEPDDIRFYPTGKVWIPFYFGGDTMRADWSYSRVGKVVFSNPSRWTRTMTVVELRPNPDEP